jgi:glycosyltransferase involved in cell wall biosynthesis
MKQSPKKITPTHVRAIQNKPSTLKKIPFFSVVLPLHAHRAYYRQSLRSILAQKNQDFEILATGDGALGQETDAPRDQRIKRIAIKGADVSTARNAGVKASRGKYIAFLDPGDEWDQDFLSGIKQLVEDFPGAGMYGTNYRIDDGKIRRENPLRLPEGWRGRRKDFYDLMYYGRPPFCVSSLVMPSVIARQYPFPEGILAGEDLVVWFKISLKRDMVYLKRTHALYRMKAFENKQGRYFGPLKHLDWLALGNRLKREDGLSARGGKFTVWATLLQVRKMLDNGRKEQAMELWARCPKNMFIPYQAYVACLAFLPTTLWKSVQPGVKIARWLLTGEFLSRPVSGKTKE